MTNEKCAGERQIEKELTFNLIVRIEPSEVSHWDWHSPSICWDDDIGRLTLQFLKPDGREDRG